MLDLFEGRGRSLASATSPSSTYLGKIVTSFLAHPSAEAPPGYEHRAAERALA